MLNVAPSVCKDPWRKYKLKGIMYKAIEARDDRSFNIIKTCLGDTTKFIDKAHAQGRTVWLHCMAGVNRS